MGQVIFLGTGDPLNEERAQTCLAVPLAADETMLIDVSGGIDVLRQLTAAGIPLEKVRHLFVTHRHFDHAGGLAPFLVALTPLSGAGLTVHALPETLRALRELLGFTIPGVEDWMGERLRWEGLTPGQPVRAGDLEVIPFEVDHGIECAGFRLAQGGSILVYAADTRPCENVVEYARDADLLIHEAYGLAGDAKQAHAFGHSTAAEAGKSPSPPGRSASYSPTSGRADSPIRTRWRRKPKPLLAARSKWRGISTPSVSEQGREETSKVAPRGFGTL